MHTGRLIVRSSIQSSKLLQKPHTRTHTHTHTPPSPRPRPSRIRTVLAGGEEEDGDEKAEGFLLKGKVKEEETVRGRGGGEEEVVVEVVARAETKARSHRKAGTRKESCCGCARASCPGIKSLLLTVPRRRCRTPLSRSTWLSKPLLCSASGAHAMSQVIKGL
jgi:hypothetical protein